MHDARELLTGSDSEVHAALDLAMTLDACQTCGSTTREINWSAVIERRACLRCYCTHPLTPVLTDEEGAPLA